VPVPVPVSPLDLRSLRPILGLRETHQLAVPHNLQPRPAIVQMPRHKCHVPTHSARDSPQRTRVVKMRVGLRRQFRGAAAADIEPQGLDFREAFRHAGDELERYGHVGVAGLVDHVHELEDEAEVLVRCNVVAGFVSPSGMEERVTVSLRTGKSQNGGLL
jgi:hypothetical protein